MRSAACNFNPSTYSYADEDKRIMAAVARHVTSTVEGKATSNVVALGRKRLCRRRHLQAQTPDGLSIHGRQLSDSKFDLTVGELAPVFDNGCVATGRTFVEDLAGLGPSLLQGQSEIFAQAIRDTVRSSHCVNSQCLGDRRNERLL
jgi:hypothetical protein